MIETPPGFVARTRLEKAAFDNGWREAAGEEGGWISRRSATAPGRIWLAAGGADGPWFVALDRADVAEALDLPPADLPGPGVARFSVADVDALHDLVGRIYDLAVALPPAPVTEYRRRLEAMPTRTEAVREVTQRIGQDVFRAALMRLWGGRCPLTGIGDPALLRASHMKPWADCASDEERLDPYNGLLLSALWDAAFDQGLVTFSDAGEAMFSPQLSPEARGRLAPDARPLPLRPAHRPWLAWHREHVFRR